MNEDLRLKAREFLLNHYEEKQIVLEPELQSSSVRPDLAVRTQDATEYLLLVECSSMSTQHRRREDIKQLRRMMEIADVEYGLLFSDDFEYLFELTEFDNELVEREIPDYPESRATDFEDVLSEKELEFRLWRARDLLRDRVSERKYHQHLFHALFRKFVAQEKGLEYDIDNVDEDWITTVDDEITNEYPSYSPNVAPQDAEIQRRILRSFEGVDLGKIQPRTARAFTGIIESSRQSTESMTPLDVADALVELANPEQGDRILDPAAGIGNTIREAALRGTDASAVEINPNTVNIALFLNAVNEVDIDYFVADFLKEGLADESDPTLADFGDDSQLESPSLPVNQDHVLIDPPFGLRYERPDGGVERNAEELFVLKSLQCLRSEGTVTAVLPQGSLYKQKSEEFRNQIREDYRIKTIIEVNQPVFQHTALPTVIVQITNEPVPRNAELQYAIVEKSAEDDELIQAVQKIRDGDAPSLQLSELDDGSYLPSEIVGANQVTQQLRDRFGEIVELEERANELRTGVKLENPVPESQEGTIPFLRPQDVSQGSVSQYHPYDEETITAGPEDVLLSVKGDTSVVYTPSAEVVPASNWAIIRFDSHDEALVYATFFESDLGQEQLSTIRTGATIPYIPLRRLKEVYVPLFTKNQIENKATHIRSLRETAREYERQRTAIEDQIEDIVGGDWE